MRKLFVLMLVIGIVLTTTASSQTRRRGTPKRSTRTPTAATTKPSGDLENARRQVATQLKTMTQFLYVFSGVVKGIDCVEQTARAEQPPASAIELSERNKTKVKESIRNLIDGLDKMENSFRSNPGLSRYYPYISGVAVRAEAADNQARANRFDEAGRSLLRIVDQLTDALASMR